MSKARKKMRELERELQQKKSQDTKALLHLDVAVRNAEKLVNLNVLDVWPPLHKAQFQAAVWNMQPVPNRQNIVKNIALYMLSLNMKGNPHAVMAAEIYDEAQNLLATYRNGKAEVWR